MKPATKTLRPVSPALRAFKTRRAKIRAARRLASRTAYVVNWWTTLQQPRPEYMTPLALQVSLRQPMRRMAASLRWLGWQKIVRRMHGTPAPLWLPPTSKIKPRARGRPRLYAPYEIILGA